MTGHCTSSYLQVWAQGYTLGSWFLPFLWLGLHMFLELQVTKSKYPLYQDLNYSKNSTLFSGGEWSTEEVRIVREKVLHMLDQDEDKKAEMFKDFEKRNEYKTNTGTGHPVSEMVLFRLSFHDCIAYKDGSPGCEFLSDFSELCKQCFGHSHLFHFWLLIACRRWMFELEKCK